MGQENQKLPKQSTKSNEEQIIVQSQKFIIQQNLALPKDQNFNILRTIIAKIQLYGHQHLLDHIKGFNDSQRKLQIFKKWQREDFANLDLLFQHLIRKKIMKISDQQLFTEIKYIEKYNFKDIRKLQHYYTTGQTCIKQKKVAILMFPGSSSTKNQLVNLKQFFKQTPQSDSLFDIMIKTIENIGKQYGFPLIYMFCTPTNINKVKQQIKKYNCQNQIHIYLQQTLPVLNLNGNICIKTKNQADLVQMPRGSGNFSKIKINGVNLLQILQNKGIEYVSCPDFQNIFETIIDPYMIGYLHQNKQHLDVVYKCANAEDTKQKIFRKCVVHNGQPKIDTVSGLSAYVNYNVKYRQQNNKVVNSAPIWTNHLVFNLDKVIKILKQSDRIQDFPDAVTYKMKYLSYWSPIDHQQHNHEACYVFQRQISDILINNLFKSKAIMVDRIQEYFPIMTENKKYSYIQAYRQFLERQKNQTHIVPFYRNRKYIQKYQGYEHNLNQNNREKEDTNTRQNNQQKNKIIDIYEQQMQ